MIKIICLGKLKDKYSIEASNEFIKRLSKYTKLDIIELKDEKIGKNDTDIKEKEADKILQHLKDYEFIVALDETGQQKSSQEFATFIKNKKITFIIGGALGLHQKIRDRANTTLTFSKMTFTHQMIRVFLLEQIYRAHKILNNENYHK